MCAMVRYGYNFPKNKRWHGREKLDTDKGVEYKICGTKLIAADGAAKIGVVLAEESTTNWLCRRPKTILKKCGHMMTCANGPRCSSKGDYSINIVERIATLMGYLS